MKKKYKLAITQQPWGCRAESRDAVNDVVVSAGGARWVLDSLG